MIEHSDGRPEPPSRWSRRVRPMVRLAGLTLAAAAAAALVSVLFLPEVRAAGKQEPPQGWWILLVVLVLVGSLLSGWRLLRMPLRAARVRTGRGRSSASWWRSPLLPLAASLLVACGAVLATASLPFGYLVGPRGPVAAAAAGWLAVGWLLVAAGQPRPDAGRPPATTADAAGTEAGATEAEATQAEATQAKATQAGATEAEATGADVTGVGRILTVAATVVCALVVTVTASVVAVRWYTGGRVDATTAQRLRGGPVGAPLNLDRQRWHLVADTVGTAVMAGRYLALREPDGVRVVDAVTGTSRWHYRRGGAPTSGLARTDDGKTLVLTYAVRGGMLAVGFTAATGDQRWTHVYRDPVLAAPTRFVAAGDTLLGLTRNGPAYSAITALDARTGVVRWRWRGGASCLTDAAVVDLAMVATFRCERGGATDQIRVVAFAVADGSQKWTWRPEPSQAAIPTTVTVDPADGDAMINYLESGGGTGDRSVTTLLDGTTGFVWARHTGRPGPVTVVSPTDAGGSAVGGAMAVRVDTWHTPGADRAVTAVDLATGQTRWTARPPRLSTSTPIQIVVAGPNVYLVLRDADGDPFKAAPGLLSVVALDAATGSVRAEHRYSRTDPFGRECVTEFALAQRDGICPDYRSARLMSGDGPLVLVESLPVGYLDTTFGNRPPHPTTVVAVG